MAVGLDTLVYHFNTNNTGDIPITVAANTNRVLVFLISISDTATVAVSSVTGAGATWSQVGTGGTNIRVAVWKGLNPTAGAQTVTVTLTAIPSSDWGGHLYSLFDADQVTGVSRSGDDDLRKPERDAGQRRHGALGAIRPRRYPLGVGLHVHAG